MKEISRRAMLARTGTVASAMVASSAIQGAGVETAAPALGKPRLKVVVAGGHPGDPEYGCGGTIARFIASGHEAVLLYLNEGEPEGTPPSARGVRVKEAQAACSILGARAIFAGQIDGSAIIDSSHYEQFQRLIEKEKPDAVFTHWPIDNHRDHRAISMLVYDSWVRLKHSFALYYYEVSNGEDTLQFSPTHHVDISKVEETKRAACQAHASQNPGRFYPLQQMVTRFRGVEAGYKEAEAFIRQTRSPDFALP